MFAIYTQKKPFTVVVTSNKLRYYFNNLFCCGSLRWKIKKKKKETKSCLPSFPTAAGRLSKSFAYTTLAILISNYYFLIYSIVSFVLRTQKLFFPLLFTQLYLNEVKIHVENKTKKTSIIRTTVKYAKWRTIKNVLNRL